MNTINLYHISDSDLLLIIDCLKYVREDLKVLPNEIPDYLSIVSLVPSLRGRKSSLPRLIARLEKRL